MFSTYLSDSVRKTAVNYRMTDFTFDDDIIGQENLFDELLNDLACEGDGGVSNDLLGKFYVLLLHSFLCNFFVFIADPNYYSNFQGELFR